MLQKTQLLVFTALETPNLTMQCLAQIPHDLASNADRRSGNLATNRASYVTAYSGSGNIQPRPTLLRSYAPELPRVPYHSCCIVQNAF
jgi:hypothetical protein